MPRRWERCSPARRHGGKRLRQILHDNDVTELDARAEALIAAADRAQHFAEVVLPALREGRTVVSDRSVYSTLAYQGYGRQLDLAELRRLNDWAMQGVWPSLVVFIEAHPDTVAGRLDGRHLDRFERAGDEFHAASSRDIGRWRPRTPSTGSSSRRKDRRRSSPPRCSMPCGDASRGRASMADDDASVWAEVVGQDRAVDAAPGLRSPGARLPVHRSAGIDEGRGGAGVRRCC